MYRTFLQCEIGLVSLVIRHGKALMLGQSKISTFFQRQCSSGTNNGNADMKSASNVTANDSSKETPCKRKRDLNDNQENRDACQDGASPVSKKPLCAVSIVSNGEETKTCDHLVLSPKQKNQVEENRLRAKLTLVSKQTHGLVTNLGTSWFAALEPEFSKPYFLKLAAFVANERKKHTVYPTAENVFSWTQMTHIDDTKVVIIGQDPYHGPNQAHGLCFSVQKGVAPPPSLENMYKELSTDIEGFVHPRHGSLVGWAQQGVLLLNAVLTVRAHCANSHKDQGWEKFTDAVIAWLDSNTSGTVFILWGMYAQKKGAHINRSKHHVLQGVHPSPLSAHRSPGFFGCHHFSRCNELLQTQGKTPIDWKRFV